MFSEEEISLIKETTATYPKLSQFELAGTVCELIGWVQPNGKPKIVPCLQFLRELANEGELTLPVLNEKQREINRGKKKQSAPIEASDISWIDMSEMRECGSIELEIIRPGKRMKQWRTYMSMYHSLGDPYVHGSRIRYMIKTTVGRDLGCLLFSASSWALAHREEWIGWTMEEKKKHLHLIVNNSRFMLLPWIRVRNLASRSLSMATKQIQRDWLCDYCYAPVLMETFVDEQYDGATYKAANWIYLGETQGRGRNDRYGECALTRKSIFMYPLQRDFKEVLTGKKPWKAVEPHV